MVRLDCRGGREGARAGLSQEDLVMPVRLIYRSRISEETTARDMLDIMSTSRSRNREVGITGILLSNGKEFMQILEGPAEAVNALFVKLVEDPRHTRIELIHYGRVETRLFDDWRMRDVRIHEVPDHCRRVLEAKYGLDFDRRMPDDYAVAVSLALDAKSLATVEEA
jgi:hypothetical protein